MSLKYIPNTYRIEIDITYMCTLKCYNCNRCLSIAPGNKDHNMSLSQIRRFVEQSKQNQYPWERMRIIGGEPTIHPEFDEIVDLLSDYRLNYNKTLDLRVSTNGFTSYTKEKIDWVKKKYPNIIMENSWKNDNVQNSFSLTHVAPCDIYAYKNHQFKGCWVSEECGLGMNYSGIYCCSVGGAIANFFSHDIGIKDISNINIPDLAAMHSSLCSLCGLYHNLRVDREKVETIISPTWEKQIEKYNKSLSLSRF